MEESTPEASKGPKLEDAFRSRLEELINRMSIQQERGKNMLTNLPAGVSDEQWFRDAGKVFQNSSAMKTDSNWVNSMIDAGVPIGTILKVWDMKDERSLKEREENDLKK